MKGQRSQVLEPWLHTELLVSGRGREDLHRPSPARALRTRYFFRIEWVQTVDPAPREKLAALIDWEDPVVKHGLAQRIKYARLVQRNASSPQAKGADALGYRMERKLRAANPEHYDAKGRIRKAGKHTLRWKRSRTAMRKPGAERRPENAHGRHSGRSSHAVEHTEPVLPRLWSVCEKATFPAVSSVQLWHWAGAARPLLGLFSRLP